MINIFKNYKYINFLIYIFPFILITGPALPDIILTCTAIVLIYKTYIEKNYEIFNQTWFKVGVLLWLWFIFVSFFAYNNYLSFIDSIIFIRFIIFILAVQYFLSNNKIRNNTIKIIFVFSIFITIDSGYQFFNYDSETGFKNDIFGIEPEGLYGRISGPFKDLVPGSVLTKFFFISLILYSSNLEKYKKITALIIFSTIISLIFFSGERVAFATLLLGILILFFLPKFRIFIILCSVFSSLFIFIVVNSHPIFNDYTIIQSTSQHEGLLIQKTFPCKNDANKTCSKKIRMQPRFIEVVKDFKNSAYGEIYNTALNMWKDNKFTGVGLNNFSFVCNNFKKYDKFHKHTDCATHPHNFYIQALAESGIIGFFIFTSLIVTLIISILKSNQETKLKFIFVISLVVVFWPIISTGSFLKNWHMALVSYLIGICLSNIRSWDKKI
ncbi:MAG: hypothetical protein CFH21_00032 [Alphaproteobacteria bacterium MarineAlpha5_Bin11]|nr:MAG: hypothetical protein CFH21_00032 [Alphaproteobacteria bacterium MarineAlpha5_Bin11]PPR52143.1 MAG: hypothetical protein CFH20_00048 [Alphaproteobacteria bacterium MarineAlpha5_Bin10]